MTALTFTVEFTAAQVEEIVARVAAILAAQSAPPAPAAFVTVAEAAAILGVQPKTIHNRLSSGRLSRHGGPRRPLVDRVEVEALAAGAGRAKAAESVQRASRPQRDSGRTFTDRARGGIAWHRPIKRGRDAPTSDPVAQRS